MRKNKIRNNSLAFDIFAYGILTLFVVLCLLPIINVISLSFSGAQMQIILLPKKITLYSYSVVLSNSSFLKAFANSIFVTVVGTLFTGGVTFFAAYPLSKPNCPFRKTFMMFFIITMLFSGGVISNFLWFKELGLLDSTFSLILPFGVQTYYLILFKSYFEGIPDSIEEAAEIDGASKINILIQIVLPLCVPAIITVCLFLAVAYWNDYQRALYYLPTNHEAYPLAMYIQNYLNSSAINDYKEDLEKALHKDNIEAAMIILSMLPITCAYPFFTKYFSKGVAVGAVKG